MTSLSLHGGLAWLDGALTHADLLIVDGRIQAIGAQLDEAERALDVSGLLVLPGLVDLHTHAFHFGYWGIDPTPYVATSGVTTWVDAGTAGAYTFDAATRLAAAAGVRVVPLLNVSAIGLAGRSYECRMLENVSVDEAVDVIRTSDGRIRGVKARIDTTTVGEHGLEPLRRAIEIAERTSVPVMVHLGWSPPVVSEILELLRPGDVVTHAASGFAEGMVDDSGLVTEAALTAHRRGIVFDLGHGMGGFTFERGEELWRADRAIDVLSTDLHKHSLATAVSLPQIMGKGLALGMTIPEVIERVTSRPADVLGLKDGIGRLEVGGIADVAVMSVVDRPTVLTDVRGTTRTSPAQFRVHSTILGGEVLAAS